MLRNMTSDSCMHACNGDLTCMSTALLIFDATFFCCFDFVESLLGTTHFIGCNLWNSLLGNVFIVYKYGSFPKYFYVVFFFQMMGMQPQQPMMINSYGLPMVIR